MNWRGAEVLLMVGFERSLGCGVEDPQLSAAPMSEAITAAHRAKLTSLFRMFHPLEVFVPDSGALWFFPAVLRSTIARGPTCSELIAPSGVALVG